MATEENDLLWRLRNPLWSHGFSGPPELDKEATQADLAEAAEQIEKLQAFCREHIKTALGDTVPAPREEAVADVLRSLPRPADRWPDHGFCHRQVARSLQRPT